VCSSDLCAPDPDEVITDSFAGPWCYCLNPAKGDPFAAYCKPPQSVPEQINIQLASPSVVVASFVTYEALPSSPPIAMFGTDPTNLNITVVGVSHLYEPPGRTYILHYIKFTNLVERGTYYYKVKSGSAACTWSDVFSFRAPYSSGVTRLASYGDMGHSHHNNMGNLMVACASGQIDAILHMGDHCYDLGMANDARGDAYMNAFQPVIANCPWYPVIGNHEASDGDHYFRYLNITYGESLANRSAHINPPVTSTATTALGHLLTKGTLYGPGIHGSLPSNTSRYISTDLGLIHIVGLDLNNLDDGQVAWLEADLQVATANRQNVPWIMVTSHFPMYHSSISKHYDASLSKYVGDDSEEYPTSGHEWFPLECEGCPTVGDFYNNLATNLVPILEKYGVDIYNAGHIHDYESTWPILNGTRTQTNFNNPTGVVYITEGNGGVPGVVGNNTLVQCEDEAPYCRTHGTGGAFGIITVYNATHLQYDHMQNPDGKISDSFVIVQDKHGPFVHHA